MARSTAALPEQDIQRAVFQHWAARPALGAFLFAVPNGGARRPIEAAIMKGLGVTAGVPDIIAIRAGRTYGLELKAAGGRPSVQQVKTMAAMQAAGAEVAFAFGLDNAIAQLERWGILRGHLS